MGLVYDLRGCGWESNYLLNVVVWFQKVCILIDSLMINMSSDTMLSF